MRIYIEIEGEDMAKISRRLDEARRVVWTLEEEEMGMTAGTGWKVELEEDRRRDYLIYTNEGDTFPPEIPQKGGLKNPQILGVARGECADTALDRFMFSDRGETSMEQGFRRVIVRRIEGRAYYRELK